MKIQEAVPIQLFCLFAMLAKANGRQCYVCYEENGAITEGNCAYRNITTCEGDELYCFQLLRFTDADELFSKRKGCAKQCVNDLSTEPPSTGLKERHLSCCTGNLCNTVNVTATTVTRNTTQTSQPTPTDSATINGSSLIFITLMTWSWNLYWIM